MSILLPRVAPPTNWTPLLVSAAGGGDDDGDVGVLELLSDTMPSPSSSEDSTIEKLAAMIFREDASWTKADDPRSPITARPASVTSRRPTRANGRRLATVPSI